MSDARQKNNCSPASKMSDARQKNNCSPASKKLSARQKKVEHETPFRQIKKPKICSSESLHFFFFDEVRAHGKGFIFCFEPSKCQCSQI
jgi:hypothetical protein